MPEARPVGRRGSPLGWVLLAVVVAAPAVRPVDVLLVLFLAVILAVYLDEGFHVEEAQDGASALSRVQAHRAVRPGPDRSFGAAQRWASGLRNAETVSAERRRPLRMSADPDAVPHVELSDTPVRVLLKPFTADDLYHAVRDAITRATDLAAIAEAEIVRAHAGFSKLALALEMSRTMRVHTLDLVVAPRELRRAAAGPS